VAERIRRILATIGGLSSWFLERTKDGVAYAPRREINTKRITQGRLACKRFAKKLGEGD